MILLGGRQVSRPALKEILQNQDGSEPVYGQAAAADADLALPEDSVGLGGSKALVPQVHGEAEAAAEFLGEGGDLLRLRARLAAHPQGMADNNLGNPVFANQR